MNGGEHPASKVEREDIESRDHRERGDAHQQRERHNASTASADRAPHVDGARNQQTSCDRKQPPSEMDAPRGVQRAVPSVFETDEAAQVVCEVQGEPGRHENDQE